MSIWEVSLCSGFFIRFFVLYVWLSYGGLGKYMCVFRCFTGETCLTRTTCFFSGYTIPKGWKVLVWFRSVHLDPEIYVNPKEFNPSRWDVSKNSNFCIMIYILHILFFQKWIYFGSIIKLIHTFFQLDCAVLAHVRTIYSSSIMLSLC